MSSSVEKIKERISIVDVVSSYIPVEQSGKNFKAKCPFHNEKTPSFLLSPDRGTYYCFGCAEKGDIFSFVEKFEGIDFMGALKLLAERAGVKLEYRNEDKNNDNKEIYYKILEEATLFFENNFKTNIKARDYLKERGISLQVIEQFRIGYAKDEWRSLSDHLISKGFKVSDIEIVGLIKKSAKPEENIPEESHQKERGFYDRFRGRIIFPINDSSGRVIAFSGRIFKDESKISKAPDKNDFTEAKYLNSPDTPLFNKSNVLFGIDKAKSSIRKMGYSIVVEGQMDLVLSHQAGFTNTVAVSGTAFTENIIDNDNKVNNLGLIRRLSPNVIFAYDGDQAGIRATSRSAVIALSLDMQVKIANLPEGKDPADIIKDNKEEWKDIIKNAVDIISFHVDRICISTYDLRERSKKIREIVFPFIFMIKSSSDRFSYLSIVSSKTGLGSKEITEDFESYKNSQPISGSINTRDDDRGLLNKEVMSYRDSLEKKLFSLIYWQDQQDIGIDVDNIYKLLEQRIDKKEIDKIKEQHEPYKEDLASDAKMCYGNRINGLSREVDEIILNLEEEILNENKILLISKIDQKSTGDEPPNQDKILEDYQKTVERIEEIKRHRAK